MLPKLASPNRNLFEPFFVGVMNAFTERVLRQLLAVAHMDGTGGGAWYLQRTAVSCKCRRTCAAARRENPMRKKTRFPVRQIAVLLVNPSCCTVPARLRANAWAQSISCHAARRSASMRSSSGGWVMNRRAMPPPPEIPKAATDLGSAACS